MRPLTAGGQIAGANNPLQRCASALGLCAQLVALLAYTLDARLPHSLALSEYCNWRVNAHGLSWRYRRLSACCAALSARCGAPPSASALAGLDAVCTAAAADAPPLGRVEAWMSEELAAAWAVWEAAGGGAELDADIDEPPEHLHWPETNEMEELSCTPPPPAPAASLVTSAAASLASMWRGWTK
ncbi:hypothetical protein O0L34_g3756 [Tuta absoluta]|nr:hypothetical protein O0L34_g3756 [Tuta absoluta]